MPNLPILSVIPQLCDSLNNRDEVILEAPPGAGKTTQVPLSLINETWLGDQKILMLEPRRLAAKNAATRMADMLNESVGETVGYRIRLEQKISSKTRIEIITEGILSRLLQTDPSLDAYGLVIFDEFHERSLDADLGLALTQEARSIFRDDLPLKILIMSATLDGKAISTLMNDAPIVSSKGRAYPVDLKFVGEPKRGQWLEKHVVNTILQAISDQSGSILCFLPGSKEIRQTETLLNEALKSERISDDIVVSPLHGNLKLSNQQQAINPAPSGKRKIVLATNIAETSLTIEGITVVIDSGLGREAKYDPNTAMTRLFDRKVSKATATQRAGRAGRLSQGTCYRLWSESQQDQLTQFDSAEILQADLTGLALQLLSWDIQDTTQLCWLDSPPESALLHANHLLQKLGAVSDGKISKHGEALALFRAHPRIGHMLIKGTEIGLSNKACLIAALLMEKDPLRESGANINDRLEWLESSPYQQKELWKRLHKQAKQYQQLCLKTVPSPTPVQVPVEEQAGLLLAFAYPDRIAKQRSKGSTTYKMSNGRAANLFNFDKLTIHQWISIAQVIGKEGQATDLIPLAAPINPLHIKSYLKELTKTTEVINWDNQTDRIVAESQTKLGTLAIDSTPLKSPSQESITSSLIEVIRKRGIGILPWTKELLQWKQRVSFLHNVNIQNQKSSADASIKWPNLSDKCLEQNLETWLGPYLHNVTRLAHLKQLDMKSILHSLLPWPLPQELDKLAPEKLRVPSGSSITIDYSHNPPVLAVKLQEMFGCKETPKIANQVALQLHLLSPARRPLQVTQDLASFWANAYKEVQKDMKGRYPKHPWPDNPLEAIPTSRVKHKRT